MYVCKKAQDMYACTYPYAYRQYICHTFYSIFIVHWVRVTGRVHGFHANCICVFFCACNGGNTITWKPLFSSRSWLTVMRAWATWRLPCGTWMPLMRCQPQTWRCLRPWLRRYAFCSFTTLRSLWRGSFGPTVASQVLFGCGTMSWNLESHVLCNSNTTTTMPRGSHAGNWSTALWVDCSSCYSTSPVTWWGWSRFLRWSCPKSKIAKSANCFCFCECFACSQLRALSVTFGRKSVKRH